MRKLSLGLLTLAMAAVVFTSCKKDENAAPVVSFTNIADSISTIEVTADSYDLTVQVTSEAGLKEVKISETKNGTTTDKETISTFENNADFTKVYKVSGIPTSGMDVTISATDKDDQNTTRKISLKKKEVAPVGDPITSATEYTFGAGTNLTLGSYLAVGDKIYLKGDLTTDAAKAKIDIIYDLEQLYSHGGSDATRSNFISTTGAKFNSTTITPEQYAAATTDILFKDLTADKVDISVEANKVYLFQLSSAHGSKKGLLLVKSIATTPTTTANAVVSIKVQQ